MATAILTAIPTASSSPPAPPPATAIVARAGGEALLAYVTAEQARAVIAAAETTQHRLLLECLWQSGGRVSEALRLRRCDVDQAEGALVLENLKQRRRELRRELVHVSSLRLQQSGRAAPGLLPGRPPRPHRAPVLQLAEWRGADGPAARLALGDASALAAGVRVVGRDGQLRPATGLDFRHGAAVHQLRGGGPLSEGSQQLGHARIDTTTVYTRLTSAERRAAPVR